MRAFLSVFICCACVLLAGCDKVRQGLEIFKKAEGEGAASPVSPPVVAGQSPDGLKPNAGQSAEAEFNAAYENWTKKAIEVYPDLGVAGSALNKEFVARVKVMRERNSGEFKFPNWPFTLATLIGKELAEKMVTEVTRQNAVSSASGQRAPSPGEADRGNAAKPVVTPETVVSKPEEGRTWTVDQLAKLSALPSRGTVKGTVTKVGKLGGGDPFDIIVVLDNKLNCEINVARKLVPNGGGDSGGSSSYYGTSSRKAQSVELIAEGNSIRLVQKNTQISTTNYPHYYYYYSNRSRVSSDKSELLMIKYGDNVSVEGVFSKKANGKAFMIGDLAP